MSIRSDSIRLRSNDGLYLSGTLVTPGGTARQAVVLVHGSGVTREEGGFFTRLTAGLAEAGVASLRFDLRGHGESDGEQQERTLAAHLNDIGAALERLREVDESVPVSLLGTSFGGGLCAYYAARRPAGLHRLVLLNPQLDYKRRYVDQKPYWSGDQLGDEAATQLAARGYVDHSPTVRLGRAFLNEVFWLNPHDVLDEIEAPTLLAHGTKDTFAPVESSREAQRRVRRAELVEIEGAQHGFAVHDDPGYLQPQTQAWQAFVINTVTTWLNRDAEA